ncbi:MAG: hypothetical protein U0136_19245 [Bdellovibrionota bacterium]
MSVSSIGGGVVVEEELGTEEAADVVATSEEQPPCPYYIQVKTALDRVLRERGHSLDSVDASVRGGTVRLHGKARSWHVKQLLQEALRHIDWIENLFNEVAVA